MATPKLLRSTARFFGSKALSGHGVPWATLLVCVLGAPAALAADEDQARKPIAGVTSNCSDCGVVRAIRELRTEREVQRPDVYTSSPQYRDTLPAELPRIGPAISLTWGAGE